MCWHTPARAHCTPASEPVVPPSLQVSPDAHTPGFARRREWPPYTYICIVWMNTCIIQFYSTKNGRQTLTFSFVTLSFPRANLQNKLTHLGFLFVFLFFFFPGYFFPPFGRGRRASSCSKAIIDYVEILFLFFLIKKSGFTPSKSQI